MTSYTLPEPTCSELFRLLLESTSLLVALAEEYEKHAAKKLDFLIVQGWIGRLELCFDSAGPLPSILTMDSPEGEALEVFRLEPTSVMPSFHFANSSVQRNPLESASKVARALFMVVSAKMEKSKVNFDKSLSDGSVCTLRFLFGITGAISCRLLLKGTAHADTEIVRLQAPKEGKSFSFVAKIADMESGVFSDCRLAHAQQLDGNSSG